MEGDEAWSASTLQLLLAAHPTLEVRVSRIPEAGLGLFAKIKIPRGSWICEYRGDVLRTVAAIRLTDKRYLMRLGPQQYVDAGRHWHVLARYINDARDPAGNNAIFDKVPDKSMARVMVTRDIETGDEIYADYGKLYWAAAAAKPSSSASMSVASR